MKCQETVRVTATAPEDCRWQMSTQSTQTFWNNKPVVHLAVQPDKRSWEEAAGSSVGSLRLLQTPFKTARLIDDLAGATVCDAALQTLSPSTAVALL